MKFKCSKCKIEKDVRWFYKNKANSRGYMYHCIECDKKIKRSKEYKDKCEKREKNRGYFICKYIRGYKAYHNERLLKICKTKQAAKQVIAKHKLRIAKRKLEDAKLEHDDYYDNL